MHLFKEGLKWTRQKTKSKYIANNQWDYELNLAMTHTKYVMDWFPSVGIQAIWRTFQLHTDPSKQEKGKGVNLHAVKQNVR